MSRYLHRIEPATFGRVDRLSSDPASERFQLDYPTWHARLAAPGSRIRWAPSMTHPIVRLEASPHASKTEGFERRIA